MAAILSGLKDMREDLLRQLVMASETEKGDILSRILELEELIADEEKAEKLQ